MMTKKQFLKEIDVNERSLQCDEDYAYATWQTKVEPYLTLITKFRNGDRRLSMEKIRLALKVSVYLWDRFVDMPTLREYLDCEGDLMATKAQMDIVRAVELKPDNAVAVKLQAERFDPFYLEEGKGVGEQDNKIVFEIKNGKQTDEEISKRVDIDIEKGK